MSRKIKGFALDSKSRMEEAKARSRHQSLMQDYEDLQKEVDVMRSHLDAATQRKLVLAAEVRFLRRRCRCLVETSTMPSIQEQPTPHPHQPESTRKKQPVARKEASKPSLPSGLATNPKKQRKVGQQLPSYKRMGNGAKEGSRRSLAPLPDLNHRVMARNTLEINQKQGTSSSKAMSMSLPIIPFDLNQQDTTPRIREPSLRLAPAFDLNEISTGDEDLYVSADTNGLKGSNDEQQSDLKLSLVCRNSGEGPSRAGKRKISWHDPVALRV